MANKLLRNLCFTLNNPEPEDKARILGLSIWKYVIVADEVGENLTPHLQGYGVLLRQTRFNTIKKELGERVHFEARKGTHSQARDYCKKDGIFEERGVEPEQGKRTDLESVCKMVKEQKTLRDIADSYPSAVVRYGRGIRDLKHILTDPYSHDGLRGQWIVGPPGSGKSRYVRENFPSLYMKAQNKWFDGYDGEDCICIDDFDKGGVCLSHYLKIWADRYACTGETKGGTVHLRHKYFVVTSNYSIYDLFGEDLVLVEAITRRFEQITFPVEN